MMNRLVFARKKMRELLEVAVIIKEAFVIMKLSCILNVGVETQTYLCDKIV
jgi:hypothetical protein